MPDEKKSNRRNDPKEQRKSRRKHEPQVEKKENKQPAPVNREPDTTKVPEKPVYEPPGPEFYKGLKRETDEILKITEEANSKYKKKEIQSNWAKYEMPIESYNDIEEQENLGADYEALTQAPLSVGGHFQFKHEKSWDINTGPSVYDKYFEIDMDKLGVALSTIPFYERNSLDQCVFSETDILNMNNRVTKFKRKYYNDKKYTTPEIEMQEKILKELANTDGKNNKTTADLEKEEDIEPIKEDNFRKEVFNDTILNKKSNEIVQNVFSSIKSAESITTLDSLNTNEIKGNEIVPSNIKSEENKESTIIRFVEEKQEGNEFVDDIDDIINIVESKTDMKDLKSETEAPIENYNAKQQAIKTTKVESPVKVMESPKNPVIESPEDLEKWLDDFLDG